MSDQLVVVRNSELSTYRACRQKWDWGWNQKWKTLRPQSALNFGSLVHDAFERFYVPGLKRGGRPHLLWWETWERWLEDGGDDWEILKDTKASELGFAMLNAYWDKYGEDSLFKVICPEQAFEVDIVDPATDEVIGIFTGEMDAVVLNRETNKIGLLEHKTGASLDPFGAPVSMDEQASTYSCLGEMYLRHIEVLAPTESIDFILFNRLRKSMPSTKPTDAAGRTINRDGSIAKVQPADAFKREYAWRSEADNASVYHRIVAQMKEISRVKAGELEIYKNHDRHCGFCEFKDICDVHESGSDWEILKNSTMTTWDPYEAHNHNLEEEMEWL